MFINTPGYFESVNVTIPESTSWETLNNEQFPHMCDIACTFTYIGRDLPTTLSPNYDGNRPGLGFDKINRIIESGTQEEQDAIIEEATGITPPTDEEITLRGLQNLNNF